MEKFSMKKCVYCSFTVGVLFANSAVNAQSPYAPYATMERQEWRAMQEALMLTNEQASSVVIFSDKSRRVVEEVTTTPLPATKIRARNAITNLCRELLAGRHTGAEGALTVAELLELSETYELEDVTAAYRAKVAALPPEEAQELEALKNQLYRQPRENVNWMLYAQTKPDEFLQKRLVGCENL